MLERQKSFNFLVENRGFWGRTWNKPLPKPQPLSDCSLIQITNQLLGYKTATIAVSAFP